MVTLGEAPYYGDTFQAGHRNSKRTRCHGLLAHCGGAVVARKRLSGLFRRARTARGGDAGSLLSLPFIVHRTYT